MGTTRKITIAKTYIRDVRRCRQGRHKAAVEGDLEDVVAMLAGNMPLDPKYRDHPLGGNLKGFRECHIKPDLLLMYALPDTETLHLVRLGPHSDLFG